MKIPYNWTKRPSRDSIKLGVLSVVYAFVIWLMFSKESLWLVLGCLFAFFAAILPDKLDPYPENANREEQAKHRRFFHSWVLTIFLFLSWLSTLVAVFEVAAGLKQYNLGSRVLIYFLNVFAAGYLVHMISDINTQMSLPLLTGRLNNWVYSRNKKRMEQGLRRLWLPGRILGTILISGFLSLMLRFALPTISPEILGLIVLFVFIPVTFFSLTYLVGTTPE